MKVKIELVEEYKKYLHNNIDSLFEQESGLKMPSSYALAVILATELVGEALDEGMTPEEADKQMQGLNLTGFMAGAAAQTVAHFNPRGDQFKKYWNEQFGVKDAKGVVNPAIVHIEPKAKKAD